MTKVVVEGGGGNWIETGNVPNGTYLARVKAIKDGTLRYRGEEREIWRWYFEILDENYSGTTVEGITSRRFTTRSKAYKWWSSATGHKPRPGEEVELEDALGGIVQITVENRVSQSGRQYSRVTDVSPIPDALKKVAEELAKKLDEQEEEEIEEDEIEEEEEEEPEEIIIKPKKPAKKKTSKE